jgi:two-component system, NtrC family, sensor histidine kinase HydH
MPTAKARPRIALVDDNADLVENLTEILDEAGYHVRSAGTVREAQALVDRGGLDVALVDLKLPDGDGTLLAQSLKEKCPEAEVILLTGHATVESAAAAVRAGAWAYLTKPCETSELLLTVEQALRQVRLHGEKRELARRAQVAEKLAAVGTLTAGLSHEIRNPLNAAALQLSVLERRVKRLTEEVRAPLLEPLTLVRDEIRRLDHILEDFLQFARPTQLEPQPVDLEQLLETVVKLLAQEAERRQVALSLEAKGLPPVAGDEGRLRQALLNLILNALQATPEAGAVRIRCAAQDSDVVAVIDDTGPGIPPLYKDRIFEPFFTTKPMGSGLGLPIVHAIITQHGGSITAGSAPDGGARFVVRLPVAH